LTVPNICDDLPALEAIVIGHVLDTGTALLIDREFKYYFCTLEKAEDKP